MKCRWLGLAFVLAVGCGGEAKRPPPVVAPPAFESPREELEYLGSLSNPTPEQWKRRKALIQQAEKEDDQRVIDEGVREFKRQQSIDRETKK